MMRYPRLFFSYLALLSMSGFLATDMYLPAFSIMQRELETTAALISASLSLFLGGFCCAQLFWGPLSDRRGNKPVLLMGISLFAISCLSVVWVTDARWLLVLRFLQATGVCAAAVCWQSLVIEYYPKAKVNKVFASIMPLVALSPALAPLLGSWLLQQASWRTIFITLTLISLWLLVLTAVLLKRPLPARNKSTSPHINLLTLLSQPGYLGNVVIYSACSASFFTWLTGSPFILTSLGLNPTDIGLSYIPQTIAFLIGGFGCRALLNGYSGQQLLPWLLSLYTASISALGLVAFMPVPAVTGLMIPFCGMALANGAIYPLVVARALQFFPEDSGKAAAFQNFLQLGACFIFSLIVSCHIETALHTTAIAMGATIVIALGGYLWQRRAG